MLAEPTSLLEVAAETHSSATTAITALTPAHAAAAHVFSHIQAIVDKRLRHLDAADDLAANLSKEASASSLLNLPMSSFVHYTSQASEAQQGSSITASAGA